MAAAVTKSVLVSYIDRNKVIRIPHGKPSGLDDLQFLESEFKTLFSFQKNIRLCVTFQRYDKDWVDLEPTDIIENKDKLGAVVSNQWEKVANLHFYTIPLTNFSFSHSTCNLLC